MKKILCQLLYLQVLFLLSTRNKKRMVLIEKGADASLFQSKPRSFTY